MSYSVHLLTKTYVLEQNLVSDIKKVAQKLNWNFMASPRKDYIRYSLFDEKNEDGLEIFINTEEKFNLTIEEDYYPNITEYGAIIIIGYAYGAKGASLIPFLREFLKDYSEMLVYASESVPAGVDYYVYTKQDIDGFTTINEDAFYTHPPTDMSNYM
jgi:hypothetical protein